MIIFESIWVPIFIGSFIFIVISTIINILNIKYFNENRTVLIIVDGLAYLAMTLFFISLYLLFVFVLIFIHVVLFKSVYRLTELITSNSDVANYLSITSVLIILAYTPHSLGAGLFKLLAKISDKEVFFIRLYRPFASFFRFKLLIYLVAFLLVFISTLETLNGKPLIHNSTWSSLSPFINQSVLTFIALDRFIKLLIDQWKDIKKQLISMKNIVIGFYKREE